MSQLKSFIITEELKARHALKFFNYMEKYHNDIVDEVHDELHREWVKTVKKHRQAAPDEERSADIKARSIHPFLDVAVTKKEAVIKSSNFHRPVNSDLSVVVSQAYADGIRHRIIDDLLKAAEAAFEKVISSNPAIFAMNHEAEKIKNIFNVVRHDNIVRMQFKVSHRDDDKPQEVTKTIFAVSVDYGKFTSKIKHYDRVYLIDNTKR